MITALLVVSVMRNYLVVPFWNIAHCTVSNFARIVGIARVIAQRSGKFDRDF
jgi:hypothetical protein